MGLMREARCAGTNPAIKATAPSRAAMPANVAGSVGVVPKSSDAISLATTNEAMIPSKQRGPRVGSADRRFCGLRLLMRYAVDQIRVSGSAGILTRSMVRPQRLFCSAAVTPAYSL